IQVMIVDGAAACIGRVGNGMERKMISAMADLDQVIVGAVDAKIQAERLHGYNPFLSRGLWLLSCFLRSRSSLMSSAGTQRMSGECSSTCSRRHSTFSLPVRSQVPIVKSEIRIRIR